MQAADCLFSRDLQVSDSQIKRVLLIGSCLTESYLKDFQELYPEITFDLTHFNNLLDLPQLDADKVAQYQLQYIQIPLRTLVGDNIIRVFDFDQANGYETIERRQRLACSDRNGISARLRLAGSEAGDIRVSISGTGASIAFNCHIKDRHDVSLQFRQRPLER
jgi:hypothetical protein